MRFIKFNSFSLPAHSTERKSFLSGRHFLLKILLFWAVFGGLGNVVKAGDSTDIVWLKYTSEISRLQFSNDDSKILTVGSGGIIVFTTQNGDQIKQINPYKTLDGEYSSDNKLILLVRETGDSVNDVYPYVDVYDALNYERLKTIKLPIVYLEGSSKLKLSYDEQIIAVTNCTGLYFIDYQTGITKKYFDKFGTELGKPIITDFLFSKNGQYLILSYAIDKGQGNYDGKLIYINTQTYQIDYSNSSAGGRLILSDDGKLLACGTDTKDVAVIIMNTQTHEIVGQIPGNAGWVTSLAFSPDGKFLAIGGNINGYGLNIYQTTDFSFLKFLYSNTTFSKFDISQNNEKIVASMGDQLALIKFLLTEISEESNNPAILYPNPTDNSLTVIFNLTVPANLGFNIFDLSGKMISNLKKGFYSPGFITEQLFLGDLPIGTYFLKIESLQFNKTFKIIINR